MRRWNNPDDFERADSGLLVPRHINRGKCDFTTGPSFFGGAPASTNDPYYSDVVTLLHMDGTNGSTTITDNAPTPLVWTPGGGANLETSVFKWGTAALDTQSANTRYISTPNQASMALTNKSYCFECWVYFTSISTASIICVKSNSTGNSPAFFIRTYIGGSTQFGPGTFSASGVSGIGAGPVGPALATGQWYHIAIYRQITTPSVSAVEYFAVNGVVVVSVGTSGSWASFDTTDNFVIGNYLSPNASAFTGYIDDARWTVGVARYGASNFTPPSGPFPNS